MSTQFLCQPATPILRMNYYYYYCYNYSATAAMTAAQFNPETSLVLNLVDLITDKKNEENLFLNFQLRLIKATPWSTKPSG